MILSAGIPRWQFVGEPPSHVYDLGDKCIAAIRKATRLPGYPS